MKTIKNSQESFEQFLVREYFRYGSINKVFQKHKYNLPISFSGYDRVLDKFRVIKSAGPNSKLSESLYVLTLLANYKISLEKVYQRLAPKVIQVSTKTLHRILHHIRLGLTRRQGVALLISPKDEPNKILIGNDQSLTHSLLGNKGDLSLPMGHSKTGEPIRNGIARVLQNEVFTENVIAQNFPWDIIPDHIKPVMYLNIADILVSVYKLELTKEQSKFSSLKLSNLRYRDISNINEKLLRPGVKDIIINFSRLKTETDNNNILTINSELNSKIYALAKQPAE